VNCRRCVAVFFVFTFLLSSVLPNVSAQSDGNRIIDELLIKIFEKTVDMRGFVPWAAPMIRFEPVQFTAEPSSIDIEYLNQTEIIIGMPDPETGGYKSSSKFKPTEFVLAKDYEFELIVPDLVPEGAFKANFDPPRLILGEEGEIKTKLTITSHIPRNATLPGAFALRVNITEYWTYPNLYIKYWYWAFFGAYEILTYSGKRVPEPIEIFVDIIVRVKRLHLVEILPPASYVEVKPDKLISIPLEIRNFGSHIDTFNFRVKVDNDSGLLVAPPPAMTLYPNEVGRTIISVATPRNFRDPGTVHPIHVEAYSIYEPDKVFGNTVTIVTRGMYVSDINTTYLTLFGLIIILVVAFFLYRRKRMLGKICRKPDKPWNIPEEKKYLEKLKTKDKKKYNRVFRLMEDEYKSSLLWYKFYCKAELGKVREKKKLTDIPKDILRGVIGFISRFIGIFKRPGRKIERPRKIELEVLRVKNRELVDKMSGIDKRKKEQVILKIKKTQEKQRRKYMKSIY